MDYDKGRDGSGRGRNAVLCLRYVLMSESDECGSCRSCTPVAVRWLMFFGLFFLHISNMFSHTINLMLY